MTNSYRVSIVLGLMCLACAPKLPAAGVPAKEE